MTAITVHPEGWKPPQGYSNGMIGEGRMLHVAGQVGWDANQSFVRPDFVGQTRQALRNVLAVVEAAGGEATDIVRLTWYVLDKRDYLSQRKEVGEAYRAVMGRHFPAMTLVVVAGLVEDEARLEIEATAALGKGNRSVLE